MAFIQRRQGKSLITRKKLWPIKEGEKEVIVIPAHVSRTPGGSMIASPVLRLENREREKDHSENKEEMGLESRSMCLSSVCLIHPAKRPPRTNKCVNKAR